MLSPRHFPTESALISSTPSVMITLIPWVLALALLSGKASARGESLSTSPPTAWNTSAVEELFDYFNQVELPPELLGTLTVVNVSLFINSFDTINEATMDYRLDVYLRMTWLDPRLAFPPDIGFIDRIEVNSHFVEKIWKPDLYFQNEKTGAVHTVTDKNELVHLYTNGTVLYSSRVSLVLSCPMKLHWYPHDTQECPLKLSIFSFTEDVVKFKWRSFEPIRFNSDIHLTQFTFSHEPSVAECVIDFDIGRFTCLMGRIQLEREFAYYFIQIYLPSILIVCVSWISFWLSPEATPARVTIGLITVLTMTTQSSKARDALPHVSYITAIDIWMSASTSFVFLAMIEYAVVNMLSRRKANKKNVGPTDSSKKDVGQVGTGFIVTAEMLDVFCRISFPVLFLVFQVSYWPYYLLRES